MLLSENSKYKITTIFPPTSDATHSTDRVSKVGWTILALSMKGVQTVKMST